MAMPPEPQEVRDELQKQLDSVKPSAPGLTVERHLVAGNEADEILRLASELKCDLVVMGTHGRTGLRRLLLGSVAESVMRKAPCAVLTVRAPASAT
jgi:nucleotide-binding universal stress UspA family protein